MTFSNGLRRSAIVVGGVVLSVVLASCSGGSEGESSSSESQSTDTSSSQASSGVDIANPKDAAAADLCDLLTGEAAQEVGVRARGEKEEGSLTSSDDTPTPCVWKGADGANSVSLTPIPGRSIQQYYDNPDSFSDFKKLTISGYSAVRANKGNPVEAGACNIFLATKENQVVMSSATFHSANASGVDPCVKAKKALKLSVSSWPAAK